MNIHAMRCVPSAYEKALKEQARRKLEKTLHCSQCGRENKPGSVVIDVDEWDDARCPCGFVWQIRLDDGAA